MTRADKLRSMTDEQLVELIFECGIDDLVEFCPGLPECEDGATTGEDCKQCMLKWLRSLAEGAEDEEVQDIQRAIVRLAREIETLNKLPVHVNKLNEVEEAIKARRTAITAMQELHQYRQIGTLEQVKEFDALYLAKCQEVNELRKRMRWIPANERRPENGTRTLVTFEDGFVAVTDYYGNGWDLWADSGDVIAWMPLPEPYRPEAAHNEQNWKQQMMNTFLGGRG